MAAQPLAAPAGMLPLCAGCAGSVVAASTALKPCGRAGTSLGKDIVRVNLGITNPSSPSYTDSLVGWGRVAGLQASSRMCQAFCSVHLQSVHAGHPHAAACQVLCVRYV